MKKFLSVLAALSISAAVMCPLVACGSGGDSSDTDDNGNTVVKLMVHVSESSTEGKAYQKCVDAFNEEYKDEKIKIKCTYKARTAGATDYDTELSNLKTEGTLPDIITFDAPRCAYYASNNILRDLSDLVSTNVTDDIYESSLNYYNGDLYGIPIQESSAGFYYNKTIFEQCKIDVSSYTVDNPWTFDEFKEVCAKLKSSTSFTGYAVDMRMDATKDETAPYLLYPFIYAAGGSFVSSDGMTATGYYDSQGTKDGFQFLQDLVTEGYTSSAISATDFFTGKCAMYLSSGWTIPEIEGKYQGTGKTFASADDWGILPYPKGVTAASATGSWSFGLANTGKDGKTDACVKALEWLTSADSSTTITNATGMISAHKSLNTNVDTTTPKGILIDQLSKTGKQRPVTVCYPEFSTGFNSIISSLFANKGSTVDTLVGNACKELQEDLNKK